MTSSTMSNPGSFHEAARWQRVCAVCDRAKGRPDVRGRTWHAHHVVPKSILRRLGLPLWDTRNALRLCTDCHGAFEWAGPGKVLVTVKHLTDENICYAWEALGVTVVQIERRYGDFDVDPRWLKHHMGECETCQLQLA